MTTYMRASAGSSTGDEVSDFGYLLELISFRPAWQTDAACRKAPPGITWFPDPGHDLGPAKAVCAGCPALSDCREWAVRQGPELKGVWGGLSGRERDAARHSTLRLVS